MKSKKIICALCGEKFNEDSIKLHRYICQRKQKKKKTKEKKEEKTSTTRNNKKGILNNIKKDYSHPNLSPSFFKKNDPFSSRLAPTAELVIKYTLETPQVQDILNKLVPKTITRHKRQAQIIPKIYSPEKLLHLMQEGIDPINDSLFIKKALSIEAQLIPKMIEMLESNKIANFAEKSIIILYKTKQNWITPLIEILPRIIDQYTLSLVCLLLGMKGPKKIIPQVWKIWNFFKNNGFDYTGPYIALNDLKFRFNKK